MHKARAACAFALCRSRSKCRSNRAVIRNDLNCRSFISGFSQVQTGRICNAVFACVCAFEFGRTHVTSNQIVIPYATQSSPEGEPHAPAILPSHRIIFASLRLCANVRANVVARALQQWENFAVVRGILLARNDGDDDGR